MGISAKKMNPSLIIENLKKKFGDVLAVDGISFEVWEGEVFGILGPNGAGKSTTLAMIAGLVRAAKIVIIPTWEQFTMYTLLMLLIIATKTF